MQLLLQNCRCGNNTDIVAVATAVWDARPFSLKVNGQTVLVVWGWGLGWDLGGSAALLLQLHCTTAAASLDAVTIVQPPHPIPTSITQFYERGLPWSLVLAYIYQSHSFECKV